MLKCCVGVRGRGTIREANTRNTNGPGGWGEEAKGAGEGGLFVDRADSGLVSIGGGAAVVGVINDVVGPRQPIQLCSL